MNVDDTSQRLDSWKEIASYLGRSVRTARRWESEEGLPVHRHMHQAQASVYAFAHEVDAWRRMRDQAPASVPSRQAATRSTSPPGGRAETEPETDPGDSIVVLPFTYLGPDSRDDYLADGVSEEVTDALSRIRSLRVISRTSSMALKGTSRDARSIGGELNVRYLLEGSVRHAGSSLRVSARLIDPAADDRLWSESFDGTVEDVFAIQEDIARRVVEALELRLTEEEDRRLSDRPIDSVAAWQLALQARRESLRWRRDAIDHAVRLLEGALDEAGENAELLAALGRVHLQYREAGLDPTDAPLQMAEDLAQRVFALDVTSSAGFQLRGWIRYSSGRVGEAVRDLKSALESDWNNPDTLGLLANCYLISGRVASARPIVDRLLAIDPLTPLSRCMPGWADALEGRFEAAIAPYREMFEMDPGNPMARLFYLWALALDDRRDEVRSLSQGFHVSVAGSPPAVVGTLIAGALEGRDTPGELPPGVVQVAASSEIFARLLAHAYGLAGDVDLTEHWLRIAADRGFINYPFLARHDPSLDGLRDEPRVAELLEEIRVRWEAFEG